LALGGKRDAKAVRTWRIILMARTGIFRVAT